KHHNHHFGASAALEDRCAVVRIVAMRPIFAAVVLLVLVFVVFVGIFRVLPPIFGMSLRTLAMIAVVVILLVSQGVPGRDRIVIACGQPQKTEIVGGA